jgi:hypothetical protein
MIIRIKFKKIIRIRRRIIIMIEKIQSIKIKMKFKNIEEVANKIEKLFIRVKLKKKLNREKKNNMLKKIYTS